MSDLANACDTEYIAGLASAREPLYTLAPLSHSACTHAKAPARAHTLSFGRVRCANKQRKLVLTPVGVEKVYESERPFCAEE